MIARFMFFYKPGVTESHLVQDREALTWLQFRERFRSHNVPAGVMKMKQKEFLALKQVTLNIIIQRFLLS